MTKGDEGKDLSGVPTEPPIAAQERCAWSAEFESRYWRDAKSFVKLDGNLTNMLRVEPCPLGGVLVIATDGVAMAVFRDATGICHEPITVLYTALECDNITRVRLAPNVIWLMRGGTVVGGAVSPDSKHEFVKWRGLVPETEGISSPAFIDPKLLQQYGLGASALGVITIKPDKPALVIPCDRDDVFTIVMPMRVGQNDTDAHTRVTSWLADAQDTASASAQPSNDTAESSIPA